MLDVCVDQGVGLRHLGMNSSTLVMAVTSHCDHENELPLLWSLCSTLVAFGFAVTVLDGTVDEQIGEPGLIQLLDTQHWQMDG